MDARGGGIRVEGRPGLKRQEERLEDGRRILFYTFEDEDAGAESEDSSEGGEEAQ